MKNQKAGQLLEWLVEPVNYAQTLIRQEGKPILLDPWQKEYLRDDSKFINVLKARRVGGSWVMTLKMFIRSQLLGNYSGTFISMNQEEATGKIEYANQMYESLPRRFRKKRVARSRTEIVFEDSSGRRAVLRSLASRAPRGRGGDVGISELPHCMEAQKIYEGALHVTSRSPQHMLTIESTPIGRRGIFYDISRGRFRQFKRYEVPWWHCRALCTDIKKANTGAPLLSTKQRVENFGTTSMKAIYASMDEDAFRQESELEFVESGLCAFPATLLQKNCTASFGTQDGEGLRFMSLNRSPAGEEWHWLAKNKKGTLIAGYDVGRKKDESVLFVLDDLGGRMEARMMVRLKETDFAIQEEMLKQAMKGGVTRLAIDSTGIGLPLAENLCRNFGDSALPVHFTVGIKNRLVAKTKMLLMDSRLLLPLERNLLAQMQSVEQKVTDSGNIIYHVTGTGGHHADIAWSLMLACHAAQTEPEQSIHYEQLITRDERKLSWRW